jgi:hypothetical protein
MVDTVITQSPSTIPQRRLSGGGEFEPTHEQSFLFRRNLRPIFPGADRRAR